MARQAVQQLQGFGEEIGVAHASRDQLGLQGLGHCRLTGNIIESLRSVFPI